MRVFNYTLVAEGSSDAALMHVIDWIWRQWPELAPTGRFFDPGKCGRPRGTLAEKARNALHFFPCDVLFVHRDADTSTVEHRDREIREAVRNLQHQSTVSVIPVRAAEAWFLFDEEAIRAAAGNPNGCAPLDLPPIPKCETESDPKGKLLTALRDACGLHGRRLKRFSAYRARARTAELILDFSPLRNLNAFRKLEGEMAEVASRLLSNHNGTVRHV